MSEEQPVRLVLTPEQREIVRRMSGQHVEAIDLEPDPQPANKEAKGGVLRFLWRLSAATGIPRQAWVNEDPSSPTAGGRADG
jgi:hypothetical protein